MSWIEVSTIVASDAADVLSDCLTSSGALSVSLLEAGDTPLLEPKPGEMPLWQDKVKIVGLFSQEAPIDSIKKALLTLSTSLDIQVAPLADQDWTRTWLEHFKPLCFGNKLWVCPTQQSVNLPGDAIVMKLDPGLAFGTGTHPTTALCLTYLDAHPPQDQTVIDYGCGSGILAIAASLLGAQKVWAIDYDPQALTSTHENAARNDIEPDKISACLPADLPPTQSDLIMANILATPLITLAQTLADHCKPGGVIVLSGILTTQAQEVKAAYTPWFEFNEMLTQDDWVLLSATKKEP